jgi:hypothetical protein
VARNLPILMTGDAACGQHRSQSDRRQARLERVSLLRKLVVFKLGALAGVMAAAAVAKLAVQSRGDEDSDELALAAIYDGIDLKSRARAFRGGSLLAWFGGIELDLREAELTAGAELTAHAIFGGIQVRTPPHWRVESSATAIFGGVDVRTHAEDDPDAPLLRLKGKAVFGGIDVRAKNPAA